MSDDTENVLDLAAAREARSSREWDVEVEGGDVVITVTEEDGTARAWAFDPLVAVRLANQILEQALEAMEETR